LVLAGLACGCKTTFRTVDEHFVTQPANCRRVQILPVTFAGAGNLDHSFTTSDLLACCRQTEKDLTGAVQQELRSKGYEVVGPVQILHTDAIPVPSGADIQSCLAAVRIDLFENLPQQYSASVGDRPLTFQTNTTLSLFRYMATPAPARLEHNPFHYQVAPSFTNLLVRLGATNAAAVLLVDTKAFFESPHHRTQRALWNWTGGGLTVVVEFGVNVAIIVAAGLSGAGSAPVPIGFDPFWHSDNSLQHNFALVDARTREVLWLNQQNFKRQDPRDAEVLAEAVAGTLRDLPPTGAGKSCGKGFFAEKSPPTARRRAD
jgi:hypothetical protein